MKIKLKEEEYMPKKGAEKERVCGFDYCTKHYPVGKGWKYERILTISDGKRTIDLKSI
jgi:hypothetical protein